MKGSQLVLLDVLDGILFAERTACEGEFGRPHLGLPLISRTLTSENLDSKKALRLVRRLKKQTKWNKAKVIVGIESDPLHPFNGKFDVMIRCLDEIVADPPGQLVIQTRSPLLVLALPLLRRISDRIKIVMAFEALNDSIHHQFTPFLPKPSERMTAARTLHRFGIDVNIQVAPIVGTKRQLAFLPRKALSHFVNECDTACSSVEVVALSQVVSGEVSQQLLNSRFGGEFQKIAHIALREICLVELKNAQLIFSPENASPVAA